MLTFGFVSPSEWNVSRNVTYSALWCVATSDLSNYASFRQIGLRWVREWRNKGNRKNFLESKSEEKRWMELSWTGEDAMCFEVFSINSCFFLALQKVVVPMAVREMASILAEGTARVWSNRFVLTVVVWIVYQIPRTGYCDFFFGLGMGSLGKRTDNCLLGTIMCWLLTLLTMALPIPISILPGTHTTLHTNFLVAARHL